MVVRVFEEIFIDIGSAMADKILVDIIPEFWKLFF